MLFPFILSFYAALSEVATYLIFKVLLKVEFHIQLFMSHFSYHILHISLKKCSFSVAFNRLLTHSVTFCRLFFTDHLLSPLIVFYLLVGTKLKS